MDGNLSDSAARALSLAQEDGEQLLSRPDGAVNVTAWLLPPEGRALDFGVVVIFLLAVGTLTAGAVWAGYDHKLERGLLRLTMPGEVGCGGTPFAGGGLCK